MAHTSTLGNGLNSLNKTFPPNHPLNGSKHLCSICGDRSNGKHYGTYSCEACKGFFKRVVRKNLSYICRENKQCLVDKLQRNRCQYCRYQKCLAMGMKIEAVQIENQRVKERERYEDENANISSSFNIYYDERQQTKDRERNEAENTIVSSSFLIDYQQTKGRQNNEVENASSFQRTMSLQNILEAERTVDLTLESMVEKQRVKEGERNEVENAIVSSSFQIDYNEMQQMKEGERNEVENVSNFQRNMSVQNILEAERRVDFHLGSIIEYENVNELFQATDQQLVQLVEWAKKIPHFLSLPLEDQVLLLKTGWNELLIARFSHSSIEVKEEIIIGPRASISRDTANQAGIDTIFDRVLNEIVSKMRELKMDKAELGFLRTIILYNPVVQGLKSVKEIEALRDDVYESLEEYARINHPNDPMRFAKLLIRLPSLRSLGLKCPQPLFFFRVLYDKPIDTCLLHMLQSSGLPNRIQSWNEPTDAVEDIIDDFFPVHLSIFL